MDDDPRSIKLMMWFLVILFLPVCFVISIKEWIVSLFRTKPSALSNIAGPKSYMRPK